MSIEMNCPDCRRHLKVPESFAGKRGRCPYCDRIINIPSKSPSEATPAVLQPLDSEPAPKPGSIANNTPSPSRPVPAASASTAGSSTNGDEGQFFAENSRLYIALLVCFGIMAFSTVLPWIKIFAGGLSGIQGDGKIILIGSLIVGAFVYAAKGKPQLIGTSLAAAVAWGVVAAVTHGFLIYRISSLITDAAAEDNPFAAMLASQVQAGSGLYIGILAAAATIILATMLIAKRAEPGDSFGTTYKHAFFGGLAAVPILILLAFLFSNGDVAPFGSKKLTPESSEKRTDGEKEVYVSPGDEKEEDQQQKEWVSARSAVQKGDAHIRVTSAKIKKINIKDNFDGDISVSENPLLSITLQIINTSDTRKLNYHSWAGGDFTFGRDFGTLEDNFGNTYKRITFGMDKPVGRVSSESIYPNESISDVLVFEVPVGKAEALRLELPGRNVDAEDFIRFEIPKEMFADGM